MELYLELEEIQSNWDDFFPEKRDGRSPFGECCRCTAQCARHELNLDLGDVTHERLDVLSNPIPVRDRLASASRLVYLTTVRERDAYISFEH